MGSGPFVSNISQRLVIRKITDHASFLTLLLTVMLFSVALFEKGFTHDILLETAVFLVSVKLVLSSHKANLAYRSIENKLDQVVENTKLHSSQDRPASPFRMTSSRNRQEFK